MQTHGFRTPAQKLSSEEKPAGRELTESVSHHESTFALNALSEGFLIGMVLGDALGAVGTGICITAMMSRKSEN